MRHATISSLKSRAYIQKPIARGAKAPRNASFKSLRALPGCTLGPPTMDAVEFGRASRVSSSLATAST